MKILKAISETLKIILVIFLLAQGSIFFFAFFLEGLVRCFYEYLDIVFSLNNIYYSSESILKSLYFTICLSIIIFFSNRKSKKRARIENIIKKNYKKINLIYLFIFNIVFFTLILFGNIILREFFNYNEHIKQKYGK